MRLADTPRGTICLVNMFLCWRNGIATRSQLRDFVSSCLARPATDPEQVFEEVCRLENGTSVVFFGFSPVPNGELRRDKCLSSTIKSDNFHRYLLSRSYKTPPPGTAWSILHQTPQTALEEDEYVQALETLLATGGWFDTNASLGKPFPRPMYCWFTSTATLQQHYSKADPAETKATRTRDALGLIDSKDGECRLDVQFTAASLEAISGIIVARPSFADRGNARFAAHQRTRKAKLYHARQWGTTVDLKKFAEGNTDITGLPERVSTALPISSLENLEIKYLGRVSGSRGILRGVDDDSAFEAKLRGSTPLSQMIEELTKESCS